jgi:hypothetical protein
MTANGSDNNEPDERRLDMTVRHRIVASLDAINLACDGDPAEMQAALTREVESNPNGELATALATLGIAPTLEAIEEARGKLLPPFKLRTVAT